MKYVIGLSIVYLGILAIRIVYSCYIMFAARHYACKSDYRKVTMLEAFTKGLPDTDYGFGIAYDVKEELKAMGAETKNTAKFKLLQDRVNQVLSKCPDVRELICKSDIYRVDVYTELIREGGFSRCQK